MSLQLAAQHLASRGRGPDTTLVHMAPQEVAGLQALAKAHGGSLTVNPDTGLAEAGFLSSILPMVAGAFLGPAGLGLTAMQAGLAAGALGTVATGSLKKGLMAGFGAYGGAGLAGGLMGAGTGALSSAAGAAGANSVVPAVATEAVVPAATEGLVGAAETLGSTVANPTGIPGFQGTGLGLTPASSAINAGQMVTQATPTITQAPALTQNAADIGNIYAQEQAAQNAVASKLANATPWETAKAGFGEIGKDPKRFMTKENLQYGLMGLSPVIADMMKPKTATPRPAEATPRYSYAPGRVEDPQAEYTGAYTGQRTYFNPVYTRTAAGGGLMDIGPIEAMSDRNQAETMMSNGGMRFAEGGETKAVKPVEEDPYYTMSGQSGDAFKYLMGQMPAPSKAPAPAAPTGMSGFLGGITGIASPEGIQKTDGTFVPWSASNPMPTGGGLFGGAGAAAQPASAPTGALGAVRSLFGGGSQAGATMRPYTFDPVTGTFTAMPVVDPNAADIGGPPQAYSNPNITPWDMGGTGMANGGIASLAQGGHSHLGDYSDGGRLLKGPGDGVSDSIPASIGDKRPARLADGEFVVPARIVSELGNGSTEAGARKLYAMMDRVQNARKKSIGKDRVAVNSRSEKLLPA